MGNDPLFVNKLAGAVLTAGLLAMMVGFITKKIYSPSMPTEQAYVIAEGVTSAATQTARAPAGPEPIAPLLASASVENGEKVAKKCASCHTFNDGGANKIGPNLWNVVGKPPAGVGGFSYSGAMRGMDLPDGWTYQALNEFLYSPRGFLRGTKMTYAGIKKTQDRADLIAYMRSLSADPKPLPQ
ncbi:MAG: cytochrome c family protein [Pseudomonadota bacterium]